MSNPAEPAGSEPAGRSGSAAGRLDRVLDPARLRALDATGLVDGPGLEGLDRLTRLASQIIGVPIALSSLVTDTEQFFTSQVGLGDPLATLRRTPLSHSFCKHVVQSQAPLVTSDARLDEVLKHNGAVSDYGVIAYAGFPLRDGANHVLGSFCAVDSQPREWSARDLEVLEDLAETAASEIALLLANQELRTSTAHLHEILGSAPDAFLSVDGHGVLLEWNEAAEALFGWTRAEAVGQNLTALIVPEQFRSAHEAGMARVRDGQPVSRRLELTARDRAGAELPIQMTMQVAHHLGGPVIHAFLHGVREHQDRELALQRERTFLAAVLDSVDVGVAACGSDGRMALFNKAMRRIWGSAPEPATARDLQDIAGLSQADGRTRFGPDQAPLTRSLLGEPTREVEVVLAAEGFDDQRFLVNSQPVLTADGRGLGAVVALHDIGERRRAESRLAAQLGAAQALSAATTIEQGLADLLQAVCAALGWAGGEYWQVDPDRNVIERQTCWWVPELAATALAAAEQPAFRPGESLPGLTWAKDSPVWMGNLDDWPERFPRLEPARLAGYKSVIALPLREGSTPGVLEFVARDIPEPDTAMHGALSAISAHVGRFLQARRAGELMERLAQTRADFDRVIDHVNDYVWTVEVLPDGAVHSLFASPNASGVFGGELPTDGDMNAAFGQLLHPDDRPLYEEFNREVMAGRSTELECRVIGYDGVERWVWVRAAVRPTGDRLLFDGIVSNVTERRRGQFELEEERRQLRQAQSIAGVGSWEWDAVTGKVSWSRALWQLYGLEPGESPEEQATPRVVHPDDLPKVAQVLDRCATTGEPLYLAYRITRPTDGELRYFEGRGEALYGSDGRLERVAGTAMDITDQVHAQRELADREAMLSSILANSQSLIYVKDLQGRYLMVNEPLERAHALQPGELLGQDDSYFDPVLAPVWQANDRLARAGEIAVEEWFDGPDGRQYFDSVKFPLTDPDGRVYATCGISLDVTTRRRAADAMADARDAALAANAAKSSFLATMSHEIRTPMNAVIGMTDLLLGTPLNENQLEYVETVRTSGDALLAIINDILDFSRIESGQMELEERPFDLRRCVEDSLALVAGTAARLDLVAHVDPGCRYVRGDLNRLRQVLVNLVGNAVKFTQQGDVLVLVTTADPPPADSRPRPGERVRVSFSVRDTGIGIPPERMDRLFKSFSQVDASTTRVYGGSGLGLAISRAIVQAMGGDISVVSEVGVGSTFSFDLELERCAEPDEPARPGADEVLLAGRRVLVVDDNDTNRRILRLQLEGWGMICTDIGAPGQALAALGAGFDIAILDMHMPGIDGLELAERIRRAPAGRDLPMVLLTSLNSRPQTITADLFAGFHTKPIRAGALRTMLAEVFARRSPQAPKVPQQQPSPPPGAAPDAATRPAADNEPLRVLLAEDNLVNQKVATSMLRNLGHAVDVAGNGQEALRAVQSTDYDVVLMDIHMPTMDGLDATRAIRAQLPAQRQPHIVAMTASSLPEDRKACAVAGMNGYLLKPVRAVDLATALRAIPRTRRETSTPAIDPEVLNRLFSDMAADTAAARAELVGAFVEQGDRWMADLAAATPAGDLEQIRVIAHTLGSSSALLGAAVLAERLEALGGLARAAGASGGVAATALTEAVAGVDAEYRRAATELRAHAGRVDPA